RLLDQPSGELRGRPLHGFYHHIEGVGVSKAGKGNADQALTVQIMVVHQRDLDGGAGLQFGEIDDLWGDRSYGDGLAHARDRLDGSQPHADDARSEGGVRHNQVARSSSEVSGYRSRRAGSTPSLRKPAASLHGYPRTCLRRSRNLSDPIYH